MSLLKGEPLLPSTVLRIYPKLILDHIVRVFILLNTGLLFEGFANEPKKGTVVPMRKWSHVGTGRVVRW